MTTACPEAGRNRSVEKRGCAVSLFCRCVWLDVVPKRVDDRFEIGRVPNYLCGATWDANNPRVRGSYRTQTQGAQRDCKQPIEALSR